MAKEYFTVREAATVLDVSVTHIHRMVESGEFHLVVQGADRPQAIARNELEAACEKREKPMPARYAVVIELPYSVCRSDATARVIAYAIQQAIGEPGQLEDEIGIDKAQAIARNVELCADAIVRPASRLTV